MFSRDETPRTEVIGIGGMMRKLTLSFVGPHALRTVSAHYADLAFFSVKGVTREGYLTDPDLLEAEVKRAMIEHSEEPILLVDGSKFERRGLGVITHVSNISRVLATNAPGDRLEALAREGVKVKRIEAAR
jgi:DeoR family transcriptional regulator of aga operon